MSIAAWKRFKCLPSSSQTKFLENKWQLCGNYLWNFHLLRHSFSVSIKTCCDQPLNQRSLSQVINQSQVGLQQETRSLEGIPTAIYSYEYNSLWHSSENSLDLLLLCGYPPNISLTFANTCQDAVDVIRGSHNSETSWISINTFTCFRAWQHDMFELTTNWSLPWHQALKCF